MGGARGVPWPSSSAPRSVSDEDRDRFFGLRPVLS